MGRARGRATPALACPRCVFRLRERHLRGGRCPNCHLPLRPTPAERPPDELCPPEQVSHLPAPVSFTATGCADVFDDLDFDVDDAAAQEWLARARSERAAAYARIAALEQQLRDLTIERGELMTFVDYLLKRG